MNFHLFLILCFNVISLHIIILMVLLDIDECKNLCGLNHLCYNTLGSFKCSCQPGFEENGSSCGRLSQQFVI